MVHTKARRALLRLTRRTPGAKPAFTQSFIARTLGINQASVSGWVAGHSRPEERFRVALETLCGIPRGDWATAAEARMFAKVALAATKSNEAA